MAVTIKKGMDKKEMEKKIQEITSKKKVIDLIELAGRLKSEVDPLEFQKSVRNEWK